MDCGVDLSIEPETRDILLHYMMPNKTRKKIGRAHSENGVYIIDFGIPDCSGDSQELIDLVPLRFEHIHHRDWKYLDGRPRVPHHAHRHEVALHDPDPDGICRHCHTPIASTSAIASRGLAAIAEAEREAPPEEGLSNLELETASSLARRKIPSPDLHHNTFGACCATLASRDSTKKLTVAQEEELAHCKVEELRQRSLAESRGTFAWSGWGEEESASNEGGWGSAGGWGTSNTGGWKAAFSGETSGWGNSGEVWRASREDQREEEEEIKAEPPVVPLGRPPCRAAPALPPSDIAPGSDPWDTIDWGNEPSTPRRSVYGPALEPREPTFFPETIPRTNIPLSNILDREFLTLMLMTANGDDEAEETAAEPAQAPDEDPAEAHTHYTRTSGFRADDTIWHQRLGHPSRITLKKCIEAGVFAPGALLRPDGIEVRGKAHPRNCTTCLEATLSHQPSPLLEAGTNRYAKLEKVYTVEASANLLDPRNASRRASAQLAIDHGHHGQLITACEMDRDQGQHIDAPRKIKNACDVIFYKRLFLRQFRKDKQANANHVYANNGHSYASPKDEAAAAILEQDPRGEFTRGDHDDDVDSPKGGAGALGEGGSGSGRGAAPPAPPEQ
ncbi:unnamed protein product [Closterium sp. NIES-53]